ncbi:hypothetical protein CEP53_005553 [Fusarium sp. AF-6]|nr:hypothetical protein CEP53_005553 [Fusarium sp. AF-6]
MEPATAVDHSPSTVSNAGSFNSQDPLVWQKTNTASVKGCGSDGTGMLDRWLNETPKDEPFHGLVPRSSKR